MQEVNLYTVKDWTGTITYKKTVYTSQPKIQVVGFEYKFNWSIEEVERNARIG